MRHTGIAAGLTLLLGVALAAGPMPAAQAAPITHTHVSDAGHRKPAPKPSVSRLTPRTGPSAGGTEVVIKGRNLTGVKRVLFGTARGTGLQFKNARKLVVFAPAHAAGVVQVRVVTKGGTSKETDASRFTYMTSVPPVPPAPALTAVSPPAGPTTGGTAVTLTGRDLTGATGVRFGSTNATSFRVVSPTTLVATTAAHAVGAVNVAVSTPGGTATLEEAFTYSAAPTLDSVFPGSGPTAPTTVILDGTNFTADAVVTFGGVAASAVQVRAGGTELTATTPAHAPGWVDVTVTTVGGSATRVKGYLYVGDPTVTGIAPAAGPTAGGITVTLTGAGFTGSTSVWFGTKISIQVSPNLEGTQLTALLPSRSTPGPVDVRVDTDGGSTTVTNGFTYVVAPTLASLTPTAGPVAGGTTVTLTGTNFRAGMEVRFGGALGTGLNVVSDTQATVITPAHTVGLVDVSVTTPGGTATRPGSFTYLAAPTLTAVSPNEGPAGGGDTVTLTGTNFVAGMQVAFGGTAATGLVVVSSTQATVVTPAHAVGLVNVVVTTPGGTQTLTSGYTYVAAPTLASVAPDSGPIGGGTTVTLTGTNFRAGMQVRFGDALAAVVSVTGGTSASVVTPAQTAAGTVAVTVTTPGGTSTPGISFTYAPLPDLASVSPNQGPTGGQAVTLNGSGFRAGMTVTFGGAAATDVVVVSATQATVTAPPHAAGVVDVSVSTTGGSDSLPGGYTYVTAPIVSSVTPDEGPAAGGQTVTLTGSDLAGASAVSFGGATATITGNTPTSVTVTTPAHAAGVVNVVVTTPGGSGTATDAYTYVAAPTLTGVSPDQGSVAGGESVTLSGTNLSGTTAVSFGGDAAAITAVTPTSVTVTTPAHAAGVVDVVVTTPGGSGTATDAYTYVAAPTLTGVSPDQGSVAGGESVTLSGTNLSGTTAVSFGGDAAAITAVTPTSVTVTTPAHAAGVVDVAVTTPAGTDTLANGYTYVDP